MVGTDASAKYGAAGPSGQTERAMRLLEPIDLGPRQAPNRVLFGPHVTNLGDDDRRLTDRHRAYYERRAAGGCGNA